MKHLSLIFVLIAALVLSAQAEPEPEPNPAPEPAKAQRVVLPRFRSAAVDVKEARNAQNDDAESDAEADTDANANKNATPNKGGANASSGRLFLKKFLLFKNMFSQQEQQPIIPIIIAGNGGGTSPTYSTSPTMTVTSTGSIPTATGTITTSPSTTTSARGEPAVRQEEEQALEEAAAAIDEQELQAALAAGAQEYVVTDQEIRGTSDAKASRAPARVNLRRPGGKKGQTVSVRIPAKYRKYFKNGQKVMLNTGNRPIKRRTVQRKRVNRVRRRKNGGKRRRVKN